MAILQPRQGGHSFSTQYHQGLQGWDLCMSKSWCKYPAIAGLVVGIVFIALTLFCCLKCCCGCCGGRGRKKNKGANGPSFIPAPYLGYQNANNNVAPPAYGQQPAQFARFEGNKKVNGDSLPPMPSWSEARESRVEDHSYQHQNVELSNLKKPGPASSNVHLPQQETGVTEADTRPQIHHAPSSYTGPDFGAGAGAAQKQYHQPPLAAQQEHDYQDHGYQSSPPLQQQNQYQQAQHPQYDHPQQHDYPSQAMPQRELSRHASPAPLQPLPLPTHLQQQQQQPYTGPDFSAPLRQDTYKAYTPTESTKYEPTFAELGDTQTQTGYKGATQPSSLQAGRP